MQHCRSHPAWGVRQGTERMLGVVSPHHSRSPSLLGQREWIGSLVSGSSVQTRRVLWERWWGNQPSVFPFPLLGLILTFGSREGKT